MESDYAGHRYDEVFTAEEQDTLEATFPTGVCDYSRPGHGFGDAVTWLTYQDDQVSVVYGGEPLGPAPESVPYTSRGGGPDRPGPSPGRGTPGR